MDTEDGPQTGEVNRRGLLKCDAWAGAWPERAGDGAPVRPLVRDGYNVRHWTKRGMSCWAVSDMNAAELARFERIVRASDPV